MQSKEYLFEVVPIRLLLIVLLVFYHAFAIYSGAWTPIVSYPSIPAYGIMDKLSYAALLETFVFISGYIFGFQVRTKGKGTVLNPRRLILGKIKRLIVPSVVFSILYILCLGTSADNIWEVFYNVLCGVGHMWFLPMLFWCFIFTYFIELTGLKGKVVFPILIIAMFGSVIPLPLRLNTTLYYILFFYTGYYIQKEDLKIKKKSGILLPLSLILFAISYFAKQHIDTFPLIISGGGI